MTSDSWRCSYSKNFDSALSMIFPRPQHVFRLPQFLSSCPEKPWHSRVPLAWIKSDYPFKENKHIAKFLQVTPRDTASPTQWSQWHWWVWLSLVNEATRFYGDYGFFWLSRANDTAKSVRNTIYFCLVGLSTTSLDFDLAASMEPLSSDFA